MSAARDRDPATSCETAIVIGPSVTSTHRLPDLGTEALSYVDVPARLTLMSFVVAVAGVVDPDSCAAGRALVGVVLLVLATDREVVEGADETGGGVGGCGGWRR